MGRRRTRSELAGVAVDLVAGGVDAALGGLKTLDLSVASSGSRQGAGGATT